MAVNSNSNNGSSQRPIPPHMNKAANDFDCLTTYATTVSNLEVIRKNLRYHIDEPFLAEELKLVELRRQLDDIETRVANKDTREPHKNVKPLEVLPKPKVAFVDTPTGIADLVDATAKAEEKSVTDFPTLFIDCEGENLGRHGTLTLLQIFIPSQDQVYIVDVQTLKDKAFTTSGNKYPRTLKSALEGLEPDHAIAFWDCRADSDALYHHYGIKLSGVIDVQLADNATSRKIASHKRLLDLSAAVSKRINLSRHDDYTFTSVKHIGRFAMEYGTECVDNCMVETEDEEMGRQWHCRGGGICSHQKDDPNMISPMAERPLHPLMLEYCIQDVIALPQIFRSCRYGKYWVRKWADRVDAESHKRVIESQSPEYDPTRSDQSLPPKGWTNIKRIERTYWEIDPEDEFINKV